MSAFSKISLGVNRKRYTHNLSFDNNTTFGFGVVQPLLTQLVMPNSIVSLNSKQLLRLAPLHYPTFGRIHLQNDAVFVPMSEVCPQYDSILSEIAYKNYLPDSVPVTTCQILTWYLLSKYATWNIYSRDHSSKDVKYSPISLDNTSGQSGISGLGSAIESKYNIPYESSPGSVSPFISLDMQEPAGSITSEQADYVLGIKYTNGQYTADGVVLFKLNRLGRILRTNLVGLGYELSLDNTDKISCLPLVAYYKAYFDKYAPKDYQNWMLNIQDRSAQF